MSTSVLPQLLAVDSELSEQTVALEAQLTELKEKRKGIQTVIAMFESGSTPDVADVVAATTAVSQPKSTAKKATKSTKSAATKTAAKRKTTKAASKTKATKASSTKASSTKASSTKSAAKKTTKAAAKPAAKRGRPAKAKPAAATTAKEKATSTKRSGRTANWQRYVQENYRKSPLPDVIVGVLQAQPTNVFKIADVMNAVFKEDMPKSHFLKARNRISNILSAGARDGVWYRGRGGTYSMSEKSIKAS